MKFTSLITTLALLTITAFAEESSKDTAHHRAVYDQINKNEASFTKVSTTHKIDSTTFALTGWLQNGEVKKILALSSPKGGYGAEYYLENGQPLFVFNHFAIKPADGGKGQGVFERLYFKDGSIFKWLTTEKPAPVFHGEDYAATTELYTTRCAAFVDALKKASSSTAKAPAAEITEGTFTAIEEGDYAHWNMKTKAGEEASFFILKPDATVSKVIDNPKPYFGRKCRVTWKKSIENIPEAGGKMEIQQILSVEWLGKK
ncbi:hypothetical protein [Prosthecobacter sp.]|uniref:hypothetical protein n=1 Tax=Prosthecobacter sp. TaxID=1965333 RepID=UPI0037844628